MCYKTNTIVTAVAGLMLAGAVLSAQSGAAASFSGRLMDTLGRELPDAAVTLTNAATGAQYGARSDGEGRFRFAGIDAGTYDVGADVPGFITRYRLTVRAGQAATRDVALQIGLLHETITILSRSPASSSNVPR